jgi:hypothetical protein
MTNVRPAVTGNCLHRAVVRSNNLAGRMTVSVRVVQGLPWLHYLLGLWNTFFSRMKAK